ncbi:hypothetical protein HMPREF1219_00519 [Corynebacterium pyruviciproducens ATCC BAA-1742]|uniref:Tyr recombinase domain-containing protein n=1 Tax=Corynebacterium pyruviciproducens ATCC BAA-1742 TaxID=1125779 RepID=S2ZJ44_9CORY|nr:hypothetical protein HMPREF1219_00519 [Corynebacterium pyruviciproducens ATCC BAA-1742]
MNRIGHKLGTKIPGIRKLKSGRYQARYTGPDGIRYTILGTCPTVEDASQKLLEVKKRIDNRSWMPPDAMPPEDIPTVGELIDEWLDSVRPSLRNSSIATYESIVKNRIRNHSRLCATPADRLTPSMVKNWWNWVTRHYPDTPERNHKAYEKLRSAFDLATELEYVNRNPVKLKRATKRPLSARKQLPDQEDLEAILGAIKPQYALITLLCLFHGLRLGEALALKGKHFHFNDGEISVEIEGTLTRVPNGHGGVRMELHPPKTRAGYRVVPILPRFYPNVIAHLKKYARGEDDYVTTTSQGKPVFDTSYRSVFNRAKALANVHKPLTPHYGRVFLTTQLAENGATPKEIGLLLGQDDVTTITRTYMRARAKRAESIMRNL